MIFLLNRHFLPHALLLTLLGDFAVEDYSQAGRFSFQSRLISIFKAFDVARAAFAARSISVLNSFDTRSTRYGK